MSDPTDISFVRDPSRSDSRLGEATGSVTYRSAGACLIIGELDAALEVLASLPSLSCTVFVPDDALARPDRRLLDTGVAVIRGGALALDGHLGDFTAVAGDGEARLDLGTATRRENGRFDLVLDLGGEPRFVQRLPPIGYTHLPPGTEAPVARERLEALDGLVGEFDKPRYFRYRQEVCAHSRSSLRGCSRCLEACTTGAISSSGDGVSVDPWLCQGCGGCATVCPTGAMSYAYPALPEAVERTRALSAARPVDTLVLHVEDDQPGVDASMPSHGALSLAVEQVAAFGLDYWLTALAGGTVRIVLVGDAPADDPIRLALEEQAALLHRLLAGLEGREGMGDAVPVVRTVPLDGLRAVLAEPVIGAAPAWQGGAAFTVGDDKRGTLRAALDVLSERYPPSSPVLELPPGAPFGRIDVDTAACTLCMACVSTCPAGALLDGRDVPALRLIEANCVQCGLCEQACPEAAISLRPRYVWDSVEARRSQVLHEEAPFHCVRCQKAFATQRMIDTMTAKLADHWMFRDAKAVNRLKMCEDCRVKDLFEHEPGGLDVHGGGRPRDGGAA